ncbi:hypothetical protein GEMRC1_004381 [Eukaryota sp. GEM-RC1]
MASDYEGNLTVSEGDKLSSPTKILKILEDTSLLTRNLKTYISKGLGYHHALLSEDLKQIMEKAFSDGGLRLLSTSPLTVSSSQSRRISLQMMLNKCLVDVGGMACLKRALCMVCQPQNLTLKGIRKMLAFFNECISNREVKIESQLNSVDNVGQLILDGICSGLTESPKNVSDLLESTLYRRLISDDDFAEISSKSVDYLERNSFLSIKSSSDDMSSTSNQSAGSFYPSKKVLRHTKSVCRHEHILKGFSLLSDFHVLTLIVPDYWVFKRIPLKSVLNDHIISFLFSSRDVQFTSSVKCKSLHRFVSYIDQWESGGPLLFETEKFNRDSESPEVVKRLESLKCLRNFCVLFNSLVGSLLIEGNSNEEIITYLNIDLQEQINTFDRLKTLEYLIFTGDVEDFHRILVRRAKMMIQFSQGNDYLVSVLKVLFPKIQYSAPAHLLPLVRLEHCKPRHAKVLFNAGITTPSILSQCKPSDLISLFRQVDFFSEIDSEDDVMRFCRALIEDATQLISIGSSDQNDVDRLIEGEQSNQSLPGVHYYHVSEWRKFLTVWNSTKLYSLAFDFLRNDSIDIGISVLYPDNSGVFEFHCITFNFRNSNYSSVELEFKQQFLKMLVSVEHEVATANFFSKFKCFSDISKIRVPKPPLVIDCLLSKLENEDLHLFRKALLTTHFYDLSLMAAFVLNQGQKRPITDLHSLILSRHMLPLEKHLFSYSNVPSVARTSSLILALFNDLSLEISKLEMMSACKLDVKTAGVLSLRSFLTVDVTKLHDLNLSTHQLYELLSKRFFELSGGYSCENSGFKKFLTEVMNQGSETLPNIENIQFLIDRVSSQSDASQSNVLKSLSCIHSIRTINALKEYLSNFSNFITNEAQQSNHHKVFFSLIYNESLTGRIHSTDPNVQSTPKKRVFDLEDQNYVINCRSFIVADNGFKLVSLDFKQIELRIIAHLAFENAVDQKNSDLMKNSLDFLRFFSDPNQDVFALMSEHFSKLSNFKMSSRDDVKRLVYGIIYGMGSNRLSEVLGCATIKEAETQKSMFLSTFPAISDLISSTLVLLEPDSQGFVASLLNRRGYFSSVDGKRKGFNFRIQSSATEVFKTALVFVSEKLKSLNERFHSNASVLLPIHDEILLQIPRRHLDEFVSEVSLAMTNVKMHFNLKVDLEVSILVGESWGSLKAK